MPDDQAQSILTPVQVDKSVKADAWEAFNASKNENDLGTRLQTINIPKDIKAQLWEAKKSSAAPPAPIPGAPGGLPPVPGAPIPSELQQAMSPSPYGAARTGGFLKSQLPQEGTLGEYKTAAGLPMAAIGLAGAPAETALATAVGYGTGKALKYGAKKAGLGETGQDIAETAGNVLGGAFGGATPSMLGGLRRTIAGKVWTQMPDGSVDLDPWAEALAHPTKIGESILKALLPKPQAAPATPPEMFPGATPSSSVPSGNAPLPAVPSGPQQAPVFVSKFGQPVDPEQQAQLLAQRGLQRQAARQALVSKAPLGPQAPEGMTPTPAGTATEPGRIVTPESTPPPTKVTYQDVPRKQLYNMAKMGDIQAGLELIRNPAGFELPPNFKYLIEETAKRMPWRNLPK